MKNLRAALIAALAAFLVAPAAFGVQADERAADELFAKALRLEEQGNLDGALADYALVADRYPDSEAAERALLQLGRGRFRLSQHPEARQATEMLRSTYPDSPWTAGAYLLEAQILTAEAVAAKDLVEARQLFRRVPVLFRRDRYPDLEWRLEALVRAGEISLRLGEFDKAAAAFVVAIDDELPSSWTARARLGLAEALLGEGNWVAAADVLQRLVDVSVEQGSAAGDAGLEVVARRRLSSIHRLLVRPATEARSWERGRLVTLSGQLKKPTGLAVRDDGTLLIVDKGLNQAVEVGPDGKPGRRLDVGQGGHPWWSGTGAWIPDGEFILSLSARNRWQFKIPRKDKQDPLKKISAGQRDLFGRWIVIDEEQGLEVFGPDGRFASSRDGGTPIDIARDTRGRLYVLDEKDGRVTRISLDGSAGVVVQGSWKRPQAVTLDLVGRIYVLDQESVHIFSAGGKSLGSLGPGLPGGIQLKSPTDLDFDESGRLYIADRGLKGVVVLE